MSDPSIPWCPAVEPLPNTGDKTIGVRIIPLQGTQALEGLVCGLSACEASPLAQTNQLSQYLCLDPGQRTSLATCPAQEDLLALEGILRSAALSENRSILVGLNALPAFEDGSGTFLPLFAPPSQPSGFGTVDALGLLRGAGVYQLTRFPIARFNGVALPPGTSIRFADPGRWFEGAMESRLFTISNGNKFYSWDAHDPVGNTLHDFYHVNQKGMYSLFGESDHAALTGARLFQAKQLRYLKIGGRVFLIVGIIVDTVQMGGAAVESYQQNSVRPVAAQAIRTAGGWALAWAGAKAGVAIGGLAGVESGPGLVLTAIGGGLIGGVAGYFGADWIADWIYEN
jgi:hypothetical protein